MHLFTGLRTTHCRRLGTARCIVSAPVSLAAAGVCLGEQSDVNADAFAQIDGFLDYREMLAWFQDQYQSPEFHGWVHRWQDFAPAA